MAINCTLTGSTFISNSAGSDANAICQSGTNFILTDCTFINNAAAQHGDAINYWSNSNCTLISSTFLNNTANVVGGGISSTIPNLSLTISTFQGKVCKYWRWSLHKC